MGGEGKARSAVFEVHRMRNAERRLEGEWAQVKEEARHQRTRHKMSKDTVGYPIRVQIVDVANNKCQLKPAL